MLQASRGATGSTLLARTPAEYSVSLPPAPSRYIAAQTIQIGQTNMVTEREEQGRQRNV
jgi:hypothetical protein